MTLAAIGGLAAVLGGLLGAAAAYMHFLAPAGCIGTYCTGGYRETSPAVAALSVVSVPLLVVGLLGLAALARAMGKRSWLALTAAVLLVVGLVSLTVYSVYFAAADEAWAWWTFGAAGFLGMMVGLILGGVHAIVAAVVPRWAGALAAATSALLFLVNTETAAVLLAIPAALAWAIVGAFMLREALHHLDIGHRHAPAVGAG